MAKKIAVVAANGKAGQLIVREAVERGNDVTAFVRSENRTVAENVVVKDIMDTRLLVVGGAGSLYVNPEHTMTVSETPDFPEMFKPLASAMAEALSDLRERDDVRWTYISPAGDFQTEGERTGEYILAGEELTLNDRNESIISYADYAIAMVDEIESGDHIQQRISVVCK